MLGYPWLSGMSRMVDNGTKKGIIERTGHVRVKKKNTVFKDRQQSVPALPNHQDCIPEKERKQRKVSKDLTTGIGGMETL